MGCRVMVGKGCAYQASEGKWEGLKEVLLMLSEGVIKDGGGGAYYMCVGLWFLGLGIKLPAPRFLGLKGLGPYI